MEKRNPGSYTWMYAIVLLLALGIFAVGLFLAVEREIWAVFGAGCASLIAVLVTWPLAATLSAARVARQKQMDELVSAMNDRLQQFAVLLTQISEQQLLSDRAKAVAYRTKDRDALRRAIREDMAAQDWDAAFALANDMEREFGYKQEADRFREEITTRRTDIQRRAINEVIQTIDRYTGNEQWSMAVREAERLLEQYPDDEQVKGLQKEIENRRQAHKRQLLDTWYDAVNRKDVDGSIEILKKLDLYLTPQEGEMLQETARGMFKLKLENLKAQFSQAVQEHRWTEAVRLGDTIIQDFPNSRIAAECRETMDALRKRAAEPETASAV